MTYLRIKNLSKTYGSNTILSQISLEFKRGEFIAFLGPSGSGKTTLLRCLAGLEVPGEGTQIDVGDKNFFGSSSLAPEKRQVGMVFQNYAVWPHMTVFDNVAFPLRVAKVAQSEVASRVSKVLARVQLDKLANRLPHALSGGQQQRVALARALAMDPILLLLDEPLSNLDALLREELGGEIRRLQQAMQLTTIIVTHDQKEALSLADKIVLLKDGKIDCVGTPEQLYHTPPTPFCATFLANAQNIETGSGTRIFIPRKWRMGVSQGALQCRAKIESRLFLGSEFEYWASVDNYSELIRFFHAERFEIGGSYELSYPEN